MNAPRDPRADFCEVFAPELAAAAKWTPEQMQAAADAYQAEQITTAQSEAAWQANIKEFNK
jgi:hypothetical protein